jgi:hypothetical protein
MLSWDNNVASMWHSDGSRSSGDLDKIDTQGGGGDKPLGANGKVASGFSITGTALEGFNAAVAVLPASLPIWGILESDTFDESVTAPSNKISSEDTAMGSNCWPS